jgi:hypothetical protein
MNGKLRVTGEAKPDETKPTRVAASETKSEASGRTIALKK